MYLVFSTGSVPIKHSEEVKKYQLDNREKDIDKSGKSVIFHSKALQILDNIKNTV